MASNKRPQKGMTWAQATRDMVIASMNKGQLPILAVCAMIIIILLRLPPQDLSIKVDKIINLLELRELWAYILNVILIIGWFFHARLQRRQFSDEAGRMGDEKSTMQNKLAERKFKSSN